MRVALSIFVWKFYSLLCEDALAPLERGGEVAAARALLDLARQVEVDARRLLARRVEEGVGVVLVLDEAALLHEGGVQ